MDNRQLLKQRIDEILYYLWDPIGVSDAPSARDEYTTYVNHVWASAIEGQSVADISGYLSEVRTETIGVEPVKENDDYVAELIIEWAVYLGERSEKLDRL